jgi:FMN-dependent NADH-azoreductase
VATSYLKQILGFIGITEVTVILAGGTLPVDAGELALADFSAPIEPEIARAAQA